MRSLFCSGTAARFVVRRPGYYLLDEAVKRLNTILRFAAAKDPGVMNIQTGNVGPGPAAKVLVLDLHDAPGTAGTSSVFAPPCLNFSSVRNTLSRWRILLIEPGNASS